MKRYFSLILAIAATVSAQIVPSTGNVRGPTSATDNAVARYDGTTGKLVQNSGVTIDDSGNLTVSGGTISSGVGNDLTLQQVNYGGGLTALASGQVKIAAFNGQSMRLQTQGADALTIDSNQTATFAGSVKAASEVYAEKSGAGIAGQSTGSITQFTTVNSTTYNVTTGSAKVFVVQLASGDAALCYTSYKSSTITILGTDGTIVNSSSPTSTQLGIYKSANDHVISFKTGSNALVGGYASWGFCFLGNPVISISNP